MATLAEALTDAAHAVEDAVKPRLRGVLHEAGFAISLVTGTVIVCLADSARERVAAAVYAGAVALLFGTSAAYHRGTLVTARPRADGPARPLDDLRPDRRHLHAVLRCCCSHGWLRWTMFGVIWGGALLGILLRNVLRQPPRWVFVAHLPRPGLGGGRRDAADPATRAAWPCWC